MLLGPACICALAMGGSVQAKDLYVGKMKASKILFLGNSITLTKHDAVWKLDCGVAASAPERDFAHLVTRYIAEANGGRAPEMKAENFWYVGQYEQRYANYDPEVSLRDYLDWQPDILVLAIGENIENLDTPAKEAAFAKSFKGLLLAFKNKNNPAFFVRGRFMSSNAVQDRIMKQCCEEAGGVFVSMDTPALGGDPRNYAGAEKESTHYTDGAILAHPGDRGMKAIADALFEAMQVRGGLKKPPPVIADKTLAATTDKTLVSWVTLDNTTQQGGSALTILCGRQFDGIVLGEKAAGKWMAGSETFVRTQGDQQNNAVEEADSKTQTQMAIVYAGNRISIYRNGAPYASYEAGNIDLLGANDNMVIFGLRHPEAGDGESLKGSIADARIYDRALSAADLKKLEPKKESAIKPYAWWTFEKGKETDQMGRFPVNNLSGGAKIEGGRLKLEAKNATLIAAAHPVADPGEPAPPPPVRPLVVTDKSNEQAMFFRTRSGQNGWDSWWFYHNGTYYQYVLSGPQGNWTGVTLLTSPDACHWKDCGEVLTRTPVAVYLGSGGVWKSANFERDGRFIMNVSEQYPPNVGKWPNEQIIFFAESKDLVHWKRLPDEYVFRADDRWYERLGGRWDCIYAIPRTNGGYFGYWTGFPKSGSGRAFGQSADGLHWEALKPVECPEKAEVAAVEPMAGKYYMISQGRQVFVADRPEGPFRPAAKNQDVMSGAKLPNSGQVVTPFPRFFRKGKEVFIIGYAIAVHEPSLPTYCLPLNVAHVDEEGTLRATYWKGNDAMKDRVVPVKFVAADGGLPRMIEQKIAVRDGCVLEATYAFPDDDATTTPCLFIDCQSGERVAVQVRTNGTTEMGVLSKDGRTLDVRHRVNRLISLGKTARVRLMLKDSLFAVYLNDVLMDYFPMSSMANGRLGVSSGLRDIGVWTAAPTRAIGVRTSGRKHELAWYPEGKLLLRLQTPEFGARVAGTNVPVVVENGPPRVEAGQARWAQAIRIEHSGKTYRAGYVLALAPFAEGDRKRLKVTCELKPQDPLPFDLSVRQSGLIEGLAQAEAILPQRDGQVARGAIRQQEPLQAYWFLGSGSTRAGRELALPLIGLRSKDGGSDMLSFATDPYLGVQYRLSAIGDAPGTVSLELASTFSGSLTPLSTETRMIEIAVHRDRTEDLFKTFYQTIPDIKPGPSWVHDIQLNHYDYIAKAGRSLEPDLDELARRIPEKYRKHVLVCLHGYYDYLGRYTFNSKTRRIDDAWKSYDDHAQLLAMTKQELHRRIRLVKDRGFRCAIYYFDALACDDAGPEFNSAWIWRDAGGNPKTWGYWQKRPDSTGHTNYMLNPAHPEVRQWFLDYTKALIAEYGRDLDGFAWDETNAVQQGTTANLGSRMIEADRAMMRLVADVTREVQRGWTLNPDLALLTSDNVDAHGPSQELQVPFCLVAHGTYQDSWCDPKGWSPGLLPNHRNCLISCNWAPIKNRDWNRIAVEKYGLPQGVSNGYGDDRGPAEMPKEILDEIIARFLKRVEQVTTPKREVQQ